MIKSLRMSGPEFKLEVGSLHGTCFLLFLVSFLLLVAGCASTSSSTLLVVEGEGGLRQIRVQDLDGEGHEILAGEEYGVPVKVHYRPEHRQPAEEAFELLREAVLFVGSQFGGEAEIGLEVYFAPISAAEERYAYQARGKVLKFILVLREGMEERGLIEEEINGLALCSSVPHELTHLFQYRNEVFLADSWLGEGIAEYVADEFRRRHCAQAWPVSFRSKRPPAVALRHVDVKPWKAYEVTPGTPWGRIGKWLRDRKEKKERRQNPLAARLAQVERLWRYAASGPLVRCLLEAAKDEGYQDPFQELVDQIEARKWVGWEESQEIAVAMTGRSLRELAEITEEELAEARQHAWENRAREHPLVRHRALVTLRHLGLPEGADAQRLLAAFELPEERYLSRRRARHLLQEATGAVAMVEDSALARRAVERVKALKGSWELHQVVAPELWGLLAEQGNRELALPHLRATLDDPVVDAEDQLRAQRLLERLGEPSETVSGR